MNTPDLNLTKWVAHLKTCPFCILAVAEQTARYSKQHAMCDQGAELWDEAVPVEAWEVFYSQQSQVMADMVARGKHPYHRFRVKRGSGSGG
jgi:hypothetical protein